MTGQQSLPIGLFDSGVGGLTVMKEIMRVLPHESIIYFGDTARIPYGSKSRETIIRYSLENAAFLIEKKIKLLVIACNTASAFALETLQASLPIPVIGVIEPGAKQAALTTKSQRIAILGTKGTIQSGAYQQAIKKLLPTADLFPIACPLWVPLVEENLFHHPATRLLVREYLIPLKNQQIDTAVLGCTHYPFLASLIQEEMGIATSLIDSASTCAQQVAAVLKEQDLAADQGSARYHYFVSDSPDQFSCTISRLFRSDFTPVVVLPDKSISAILF